MTAPEVPARSETPLLVVVTAVLLRSRAVFRFPTVVEQESTVGTIGGAAVQDLHFGGLHTPAQEAAWTAEGGYRVAWTTWPPCDLHPWGKLEAGPAKDEARPAAIPPRVVDAATARRLVSIGPPEPGFPSSIDAPRQRIDRVLCGAAACAEMGADPLSAADFRRNACAPVLRVKDLGWLIVFLPSGVRVLDPEGWARLLVEPGNPRFDDVVREAADLGKPRPGRA